MSWRVVVRPEAERDMAEATPRYEARREGLGAEFREAVIQVFDALAENPLLNCRQHPRRDIRWPTLTVTWICIRVADRPAKRKQRSWLAEP